MRLIPTNITQKLVGTPDANDPTGGQTLDALMLRQKQLQQQRPEIPAQIASPWQGLSLMANTFTNKIQQERATAEESAGRAQLAQAMQQRDPTTGELTPEGQATVMKLEPEMGYKFIADSIANRREQAKPLSDQAKLQADLTAGRITQEAYNAAVGGGTWKPADIGSLRDDYTKAATTYDSAAPSFQSMKEAANTALDPRTDTHGKGVADYNMIVAYAKLLDPGSVVREGEVDSVRATGGPADYLIGYINAINKQGSLSDDVRRGVMKEANSRMKAYYDQAKGKRDWISGIATRHNVLPDDVVPPLGEFQPWGAPEPEPDPNAPKTTVAPEDGAPTPEQLQQAGAPLPSNVQGPIDLTKMPPPAGWKPEVWAEVPMEKRRLWLPQ